MGSSDNEVQVDLPRGCAERAFYGIVLLLPLMLVGGGLVSVYLKWNPTTTLEHGLKFLAVQFLLLITTMICLGILWCLFTPSWVERAFARRAVVLQWAVGITVVLAIVALVVLSALQADRV